MHLDSQYQPLQVLYTLMPLTHQDLPAYANMCETNAMEHMDALLLLSNHQP